MRAFIAACAVAMVIALSAMAILDGLVQKPVSAAFTTKAVRN